MDATSIQKGLENPEEQATNQTTEIRVIVENAEPSDKINKDGRISSRLPEIESRVHNQISILIKIQCEKRKGVLVNLLVDLEKLDLDVVSFSAATLSSVLPSSLRYWTTPSPPFHVIYHRFFVSYYLSL